MTAVYIIIYLYCHAPASRLTCTVDPWRMLLISTIGRDLSVRIGCVICYVPHTHCEQDTSAINLSFINGSYIDN